MHRGESMEVHFIRPPCVTVTLPSFTTLLQVPPMLPNHFSLHGLGIPEAPSPALDIISHCNLCLCPSIQSVFFLIQNLSSHSWVKILQQFPSLPARKPDLLQLPYKVLSLTPWPLPFPLTAHVAARPACQFWTAQIGLHIHVHSVPSQGIHPSPQTRLFLFLSGLIQK